MKVAILRNQLNVGGVEINLLHLARLLMDHGHSVTTFTWQADGPLAREYQKLGVPFVAFRPTRDYLNQFDTVVVWSPDLYYDVLEGYQGRIFTIIGNRHPGYYNKENARRLKIVGHICDSSDTVNYVKEVTPNAHCYTWYHMRPPEELTVPPCREDFGIDLEAVVFGVMCGHRKQKRVDRLIRAFAEVLEEAPDYRTFLAIAGDGSKKQEWQALAHKLLPPDRFVFTGRLGNRKVAEFLNSIDCFVSTIAAGQGGICMSASEAVGAGCFLITNRVAGVPGNVPGKPDDDTPEKLCGFVCSDDVYDSKLNILMRAYYISPYKEEYRTRARSVYNEKYQRKAEVVAWMEK